MNEKRHAKRRLPATLLAILVLVLLFPVSARADPAPLTLVSAAVTTGGGVGLTFDRALSEADFVNRIKDGFTITGLDRTLPIMNASLHGGNKNFVQLYFDDPVRGGEAVAVSYAPGNVQAADGGLLAAVASMDIENNLPHPTLVPGTPPPLVVGTAFAHTLGATGGTAPYRFFVDSGSLPPGLTLSEGGAISGVPTQAGEFFCAVLVVDNANALDLKSFTVTVREEICEISGVRYLTLDEALEAVGPGETATIKLLRNIDYNSGIVVEGRTIVFDLNGRTLNVVNDAANGCGLAVRSGGSVELAGSGELNVTGAAGGVLVSTGGASTRATVTTAAVSGLWGEAAYAAGTNAVLTVLGDCSSPRSASICVHAISHAEIHVGGSVTAWNQGVYASDAQIFVTGGVTASGTDLADNPIGVGVDCYGGSVTVGGNVTANRVGVMARANGAVTVDGTVDAPAYIQLADNEPLAPSGFTEPTTKAGYHTYAAAGLGTVWVKEPPATYSVTVGGSYAAKTGAGSFAEGVTVQISAGTRAGYIFAGWTSADVMLSDPTSPEASFVMPGKAVAVAAAWSAVSGGDNREEPIVYPLSEPGEKNWSGPTGGLSFHSSGSITRLSGVRVDEKTVPAVCYSLNPGSTVVTLRPIYLQSLPEGRHTLRIVFSDGYSSAVFTVVRAAETPLAAAFADVRETDWFFEHVRFAAEAGLMRGTSENAFSPHDAVTRGMLAAVLYRFEGEPAVDGACPFTDISGGDDCRNAVIWAVQQGVAAGYSSSAFGPDDPVTREQAAVMLRRYAEYLGLNTARHAELSAFADAGSVSGYARDAMAWAVEAGLFQGTDSGLLAPGASASRAQLAAILNRFSGYITH